MTLPVSPLLLVGYGLLCVGEILHVIGVATIHWIDIKGIGSGGLFRECAPNCMDISPAKDELKAVRAMEILALLSGFSAILLASFIFVQRIKLSPVPKIAAILCMVASIVALILTVIGIAVYVDKIYNVAVDSTHGLIKLSLGYSFDLTIAGGVVMALGGILVFFGGKHSIAGEYSPLIGNR